MVELGKSSSIENKRFQLHCQEIRVGCLQGKNHSMNFHRRVNSKVCTYFLDTGSDISLRKSRMCECGLPLLFSGMGNLARALVSELQVCKIKEYMSA
ncbi:hypothetical protein V1477_021341 [Vespula maculifrons]|uniref:Uncharacterized protein n=1 Tax=Vespula maculifrons TaxID=7453 RepID=A0ABD2AGU6_VESMC